MFILACQKSPKFTTLARVNVLQWNKNSIITKVMEGNLAVFLIQILMEVCLEAICHVFSRQGEN